MIIETKGVGPFQVNWYIVACEETQEAVVIDPGAEVEQIVDFLKANHLNIKYIANTHGHVDHVAGVKQLKQITGTPFLLHPSDRMFLEGFEEKAAMFGLPTLGAPSVDGDLNEGDVLKVGKLELRIIHTPGHSPGGIVFYFENTLIAGDTLFQGSIGRTDFPGGDYETLINSIKDKLFPLGDDVVVHTGHGPSTTIGIEKVHNPFLNGEF